MFPINEDPTVGVKCLPVATGRVEKSFLHSDGKYGAFPRSVVNKVQRRLSWDTRGFVENLIPSALNCFLIMGIWKFESNYGNDLLYVGHSSYNDVRMAFALRQLFYKLVDSDSVVALLTRC